jgi:predicted DNA-binding ribbon-helix-helix protein
MTSARQHEGRLAAPLGHCHSLKTSQKMRKRSITIDGHRTSITLEDVFWHELTAIARDRELSLNALVAEVDHKKGGPGNLSSALRVHVLETLRGKISRV